MMQSDSIKEISAALSKFQGQVRPVVKDHTNPHFKSRYADLSDCWQAARQALTANGLCVVQTTSISESGATILVTTLSHSSGEWFKSYYPINPVKADPQGLASAHTYARRYSLNGILGLAATDDDDDGNDATHRQPVSSNVNYDSETAHWVGLLKQSGSEDTLKIRWGETEEFRKRLSHAGRSDLIGQIVKAKDDMKLALASDRFNESLDARLADAYHDDAGDRQ